jgi:hypothetical protein
MSRPTADAGAQLSTPEGARVGTLEFDALAFGRARAWASALDTTRLAERVALASVAAIAVLCALLVTLTAAHPSFMTPTANGGYFPRWMAGPLGGLWPGRGPGERAMHADITVILACMYVAYLAATALGAHLKARAVIAAIVAAHAVLLLAPPLQYTDVFNYIHYARMGVVNGLNPYQTIPVLAPHNDPAFAISNWHNLVSPYGPLFTLLTYVLEPLGVGGAFWGFKLLLCAASLAVLALVWSSARALGRNPVTAVALVGLNPIVLVWAIGGDHNDILMALPIAVGVRLLIFARARTRELPWRAGPIRVSPEHLAAWMFVLAAGVKFAAVVLIPIGFAASVRQRSFAIGTALAIVAVGVTSAVAFGAHVPGVATQLKLVTDVGPANLFGWALGQGGDSGAVRTALLLATGVVVLGAAALATRPGRDWLALAGASLMAVWLTASWFGPWYIVWVLPFAALAASPHLKWWVLATGVYILFAFGPEVTPLLHTLHFNPFGSPLGHHNQSVVNHLLQ